MGFFAKLLGLKKRCPSCGAEWSKETLFSGIKCVSSSCRHYDRAYAAKVFKNPMTGSCPSCGSEWAELASYTDVRCLSDTCKYYDAGYATAGFKNPVRIGYTNYKGERKTFTGDGDGMRIHGAHLSVPVAPTGQRITLALDRIADRQAVEQIAAEIASKTPNAREKHVLRYHEKHGTTSRLHDSIQAKYRKF
jgi:hypothetical protein